jgi:hypothetical protein
VGSVEDTIARVPEQGGTKKAKESPLTWVSVIIAVLAIIVSIVIFFLQRSTKSLDYEVVADRAILAPTPQFGGKGLEVSLNGVPLRDPHLVVLRFVNFGDIPIRRDDFEIPLRISFPSGTTILSAQLSRTNPPNLQVKLTGGKGSSLLIEPLLLNDGDYFEIQMLVDGSEEPSVGGRVVGVHAFRRYRPRDAVSRYEKVIIYFGVIYSVLIIVYFVVRGRHWLTNRRRRV